jgi:hypothetical protein
MTETPTTPRAMPTRDALEEWSFTHRPITSMKDGSIAGCQCMDRVFVNRVEDWDQHIADALLASGLLGEPREDESAWDAAVARFMANRNVAAPEPTKFVGLRPALEPTGGTDHV